jgi:hypothetical protein
LQFGVTVEGNVENVRQTIQLLAVLLLLFCGDLNLPEMRLFGDLDRE